MKSSSSRLDPVDKVWAVSIIAAVGNKLIQQDSYITVFSCDGLQQNNLLKVSQDFNCF